MQKKLRVRILGTGLSALYASAACVESDVSFEILSNNKPSRPVGRTWLRSVPLCLKDEVKTEKLIMTSIGTKAQYLLRQNRDASSGTTFPDKTVVFDAYDPAIVQNKLLALFSQRANMIDTWGNINDDMIKEYANEWSLVIVTFPSEEAIRLQPPMKTYYGHHYLKRVEGGANLVVYNADYGIPWTRFTSMFGDMCYEYSEFEHPSKDSLPNIPDVEVLETRDFGSGTVEMTGYFPNNVLFVGRWATWDKSWTVPLAYTRTMERLMRLKWT